MIDHVFEEVRIFTKKGRLVSSLHRHNVDSKSLFLSFRHGISTIKVLTSENVLVLEIANQQLIEDNELMYYKCYWIDGNLLMYNTQYLIKFQTFWDSLAANNFFSKQSFS